mgnify:CR=1 FL=1
MKKTLVVYKSKSGFTKKYAEWISRQLKAEIREASKVTVETLFDYDTIIYGGGLYAGGISGVKLITKNFKRLKGKKIAVFDLFRPAAASRENECHNQYQEYLQGSPVSETFCYTLPQVVRLSKYRYRDIFRRVPER